MIKQIYKFLNPKFQNLFLDYKVDLKPRYGYGKPAHKEFGHFYGSSYVAAPDGSRTPVSLRGHP